MKNQNAQLLAVLPARLRGIDTTDLLELRLRLDRPPLAVRMQGNETLDGVVTEQDLSFCINAASRYSPWNTASISEGYLTAPGGHRIGVCGESGGVGIRRVTSLCIRMARDLRGVADGIPTEGSLLILGPPGSGKTTLLRDLVRRISREKMVSVVDERRELFPEGFPVPMNADVLSGVAKPRGIDMVLRSMGPQVIAMDEVTGEDDCAALIRSAWCGVELVATAHAASVGDLYGRSIYRPLVQTGLFSKVVVLDRQKQWRLEEVQA